MLWFADAYSRVHVKTPPIKRYQWNVWVTTLETANYQKSCHFAAALAVRHVYSCHSVLVSASTLLRSLTSGWYSTLMTLLFVMQGRPTGRTALLSVANPTRQHDWTVWAWRQTLTKTRLVSVYCWHRCWYWGRPATRSQNDATSIRGEKYNKYIKRSRNNVTILTSLSQEKTIPPLLAMVGNFLHKPPMYCTR